MLRNLITSLTFVKVQAYKSLIWPRLEYTCFAWDAHKKGGIEQLEMVQRSAAMFVTNRRAKHINMLKHLKWCSLEDRHKDAKLVMMYKNIKRKINYY